MLGWGATKRKLNLVINSAVFFLIDVHHLILCFCKNSLKTFFLLLKWCYYYKLISCIIFFCFIFVLYILQVLQFYILMLKHSFLKKGVVFHFIFDIKTFLYYKFLFLFFGYIFHSGKRIFASVCDFFSANFKRKCDFWVFIFFL